MLAMEKLPLEPAAWKPSFCKATRSLPLTPPACAMVRDHVPLPGGAHGPCPTVDGAAAEQKCPVGPCAPVPPDMRKGRSGMRTNGSPSLPGWRKPLRLLKSP